MKWLYEGLAEELESEAGKVLIKIQSWFTNFCTFDISNFKKVFAYGSENFIDQLYKDVIVPAGVAIVFALLVVGLYRSMFSNKSLAEVDEPLPLVIKSVFSLFMVTYSYQFLKIILIQPFSKLNLYWNNLVNSYGSTYVDYGSSNLSETIVGAETQTYTTAEINELAQEYGGGYWSGGWGGYGSGVTLTSSDGGSWGFYVIAAIITIWLGITFAKLCFLIVERYVYYCFTIILAPAFLATYTSKLTDEIARRYFKMLYSAAASLFLTNILFTLYSIAMGKAIYVNDGLPTAILLIFITKSIGKFAFKLDEFLDKSGLLNVGKHVDSPLGGLLMLTKGARMLTRTASKIAGAGKSLLGGNSKGTGSNDGTNMTSGSTNITKGGDTLNTDTKSDMRSDILSTKDNLSDMGKYPKNATAFNVDGNGQISSMSSLGKDAQFGAWSTSDGKPLSDIVESGSELGVVGKSYGMDTVDGMDKGINAIESAGAGIISTESGEKMLATMNENGTWNIGDAQYNDTIDMLANANNGNEASSVQTFTRADNSSLRNAQTSLNDVSGIKAGRLESALPLGTSDIKMVPNSKTDMLAAVNGKVGAYKLEKVSSDFAKQNPAKCIATKDGANYMVSRNAKPSAKVRREIGYHSINSQGKLTYGGTGPSSMPTNIFNSKPRIDSSGKGQK